MTKSSNKSSDLRVRTFDFSLSVIELLEKLPRNYIYQTIGRQLLRSATSIGANIAEGRGSGTQKDFMNYCHISLKSADETVYWLRLLEKKSNSTKLDKVILELLNENIEICKMLGSTLLTLKGKRRKLAIA